MIPYGMSVPVAVWQPCELLYTCYLLTCPFNGPFSGTTRVSRYQTGKTNLDYTEGTDSEWQRHQLGCMQVCTSLHASTQDNHASTPPLSFLQAGCLSCRPTNSVKALKGKSTPLKSYIFHARVSIAGVSCRRRWPLPTTLVLTTLLG